MPLSYLISDSDALSVSLFCFLVSLVSTACLALCARLYARLYARYLAISAKALCLQTPTNLRPTPSAGTT